MAYNLTEILNNNITSELYKEYTTTGYDGISGLGYKNKNFPAPKVISAYLMALADPKYMNLRKDFSDENSPYPTELNKNLPFFYKNYANSFALKTKKESIGVLQFPLHNRFKDESRGFENIPYDNFTDTICFLEKVFNIKLREVDGDFSALKVKKSILNRVATLTTPLQMAKSVLKIIVRPSSILDKEEIDKIKIKEHKLGKPYFFISHKFNGEVLTDAEKILAIIDYFSKKTNILIAKKYARRSGLKKSSEKNKIIHASTLLTDLFVIQAFNLGEENNRALDNAIRLQLANIINTMSDNKSLEFVSKNSHSAVYAMLKSLGKNKAVKNIIETRAKLGVTYLTEPKNVYDLMFNPTASDLIKTKSDKVFYLEDCPVFDQISADFNKKPKKAQIEFSENSAIDNLFE